MTKQELRAAAIAREKNLSPIYCQEADAAICRQVLQSPLYQNAKSIFCYVGTDREIDTMALLRAALRDRKVVAIPLCVGNGVMEARQIKGLSDLVSGRYGILAPKLSCPVVAPEDLELVIVPGCTANGKGQRLGYGGGYYDRYLPRTNCPKVMLCRHQLIAEDIPTEDHDVMMDYLVTERRITDCRQIRF